MRQTRSQRPRSDPANHQTRPAGGVSSYDPAGPPFNRLVPGGTGGAPKRDFDEGATCRRAAGARERVRDARRAARDDRAVGVVAGRGRCRFAGEALAPRRDPACVRSAFRASELRLARAVRPHLLRTRAATDQDHRSCHIAPAVLGGGGRRFGVEITFQGAPRLTPSMRVALDDLRLERLTVLYPGARVSRQRFFRPAGRHREAGPPARALRAFTRSTARSIQRPMAAAAVPPGRPHKRRRSPRAR